MLALTDRARAKPTDVLSRQLFAVQDPLVDALADSAGLEASEVVDDILDGEMGGLSVRAARGSLLPQLSCPAGMWLPGPVSGIGRRPGA